MTEFQPRRWVRNGHLQTIVGNFLPRADRLPEPQTVFIPVPTPPEMVERDLRGAGFDSAVLCHCHWQPENIRNTAPTVVLVHGLEGSSNSQYVVGNSNKLWSAGCNIIRMNMRNCGHSEALCATLYHSGLSCDVLAVLQWLIEHGFQCIALAGYSLGGNLVLKAAGELGTSAPPQLRAVVAVSPPVDLRESSDALGQKKNRAYEKKFLRALRGRYKRKRQLFPAAFPAMDWSKIQSIRDFDEYVMTPVSGFQGADDYYDRAASNRVLHRIAVPTLVIHAHDDPFVKLTPASRALLQENANIRLMEPKHGGHCAFLAQPDGAAGYDGYWAEHMLRAFVMEHAAC